MLSSGKLDGSRFPDVASVAQSIRPYGALSLVHLPTLFSHREESLSRAIFSRPISVLAGPLSRDEHRLQGRVQINIKLNYNDSVYREATHGRARAAPAAAIRNGWHGAPATARTSRHILCNVH